MILKSLVKFLEFCREKSDVISYSSIAVTVVTFAAGSSFYSFKTEDGSFWLRALFFFPLPIYYTDLDNQDSSEK